MKTKIQESFKQYVLEKNQQKEEIDLYDENRNYLRTIYREDEIKPHEWKRCVLCFVIDKNGNVLIENRLDGKKDGCSGHIKHYEVATQAVLRELYEEYKIEIEEALSVQYLGNIKISFRETNNELQCFLDAYVLFRTRETPIKINRKETLSVETIPQEEFLEKFKNNEIFPCVSGYEAILPKLEELIRERCEERHTELLERE